MVEIARQIILRIYIGNLPLDILSLEELLQKTDSFIQSRKSHQIVTLNSLMYLYSRKDYELKKTIINSDLVISDSIGIVLAGYFLSGVKIKRITGIDLMSKLCERSENRKYRIFLLGSKPENVQLAAKKLLDFFPRLIICGYHHGYFEKQQESEVIDYIKNTRPDILFVALDTPRQEKWISKNLESLNTPIVIGVGGSFDIFSGKLKRAPKLLRKLGLEWLFRLVQQPWRIKRILGILGSGIHQV